MRNIYVPLLLLLRYYLIINSVLYLTSANDKCEVAQVCIAELSQETCGDGFVVDPNHSIFGCCPGCVAEPDDYYDTEDEDDNNSNEITPENCQPPYTCLPDGSYAPVQCKGDLFTGRCFCYEGEGTRIFGQMWRRDASEMTCACSRRRYELEKSQNKLSTLHCSPNGDYEQLQCDEGICWCANPKTGQPIVSPIPESDMTLLPCYHAGRVGESYLRRCESIVYALATIQREQEEHGTFFLGNPITFCDYDGSYGSYQIQNGIAYCSGRDGKTLGSWQASDTNGMNCNCARDTNIYFPERGMTVAATCQANGNYRHNQIAGNVTYCIDSDGYPIDNEDNWPRECRQNP